MWPQSESQYPQARQSGSQFPQARQYESQFPQARQSGSQLQNTVRQLRRVGRFCFQERDPKTGIWQRVHIPFQDKVALLADVAGFSGNSAAVVESEADFGVDRWYLALRRAKTWEEYTKK